MLDRSVACAAIRLAPAARAAILRCAAASVPGEGCGTLIGVETSGGGAMIRAAPAADNIEGNQSQGRFRLAPADIAAAARAARADGWDILGFYHSHPRGFAEPSPADIAEASGWPGYLHVIAAINDPAGLRVWRTGPDRWLEQSIAQGELPWLAS